MQRLHASANRRWRPWAAAGAVSATAVLVAVAVATPREVGHGGTEPDRAKNVILFIGDGMGEAHRDAGRLAEVGLEGDLVMDTLPSTGRVQTDSADPGSFVTDSAAGATAYATGVKTYNGAIGVDANGERVVTILEQAEANGLSTGLVTTGEVTDASTAAFGAHAEDRSAQTEVARQFIEEAGVDVLLGGGEDFWYPSGMEGSHEGGDSRSDQGDLVGKAQGLGYEHITDAQGLSEAEGERLLGLSANREMFVSEPEPAGNNDRLVSLAQMTEKAIDTLSRDDKGFFLVIEEEAIDEQAHANNAAMTIDAVQRFDDAVKVGKDFADANDDTLLITTADHETGGLAIEAGDEEDASGEEAFDVTGSGQQFSVDWTTTEHTGVDVPLSAMGPDSQQLTGSYENTFVHQVVRETLFSGDDQN